MAARDLAETAVERVMYMDRSEMCSRKYPNVVGGAGSFLAPTESFLCKVSVLLTDFVNLVHSAIR